MIKSGYFGAFIRNCRIGYVMRFCNLLVLLLYSKAGMSQNVDMITQDMNYQVNSAKIKGRWVSAELQRKVDSIMGVGGVYTPARINLAQSAIVSELTNPEETILQNVRGSTSVLIVYSHANGDSINKKVDVIFYPYYLRIDLVNIGNNILPVPRSSKATFLKNVALPIWISSPVVGFYSDRKYGTSILAQTNTDLLHLSRNKLTINPYHLNVELNGMKSFANSYNSINSGITIRKEITNDNVPGWLVRCEYSHASSPMGIDYYEVNKIHLNGAIQGNSPIPILSKFMVSGGFTVSDNNYIEISKQSLDETSVNLAFTADKRIKSGIGRVGIYFDDHFPKSYKSYQRLCSQLAFATSIGKGHKNWDLEIDAGGGLSWGRLPIYSGFWAGNSSRNFLYQPLNTFTSVPFTQGALVRSLGENEGGIASQSGMLRGGTSYWNFNFSLSIPIPFLSKALVPDILISETPRRITLRSALKGAINTAESAIYDDLIDNRGYPDNDSTDSIVKTIINKDIRPTITYLADRANIYSLKPLILFDAAQLYNNSISSSRFYSGAGLGVQFTIVIAKFNVAYMRTISAVADQGKGNLLLRLTIENFY